MLKTLIVEDDPAHRSLTTFSLNGMKIASFDKEFVSSCEEAKEILQKCSPDIAFIDIDLPDGNGLDLIPLLLKTHPRCYTVVTSASNRASDVVRAKKLGSMSYITKPLVAVKLQQVLISCLKYREKIEKQPYEEIEETVEKAKKNLDFITNDQDMEETLSVEHIISRWDILFTDIYETNLINTRPYFKKINCKNIEYITDYKIDNPDSEKKYNIMFLDTAMKNIDVYQYTHNVRKKYKNKIDQPFIIAMMHDQDEISTKKWLQAGMNDFIIKPCKFSTIEEKLRKFAEVYQKMKPENYI